MALYNISTSTNYNIPKATWLTGNNRSTIRPKPYLGLSDFTRCIYIVTPEFSVLPARKCRLDTEAINGAQPSADVMINNIQIL